MSNAPISGLSTDFFDKVTGGVQEVSILLTLLGTEQCQDHIGSALDEGYLYAAAAPLSIFGSIGIVKAGLFLLYASISFLEVSFTPFGGRLLGAKGLHNAHIKPLGSIASMIGMDKKCDTRYLAETRLLQILEEKHVHNHENLSLEWRSARWNVSLILSTIVGAGIGLLPYVRLVSQDLEPSTMGLPWTFPILRTAGSGLAAISYQLLIQFRIVYLMKNRIIFMNMNPFVEGKFYDPGQKGFMWDESLPAEECLWGLDHYLRFLTRASRTDPSDAEKQGTTLTYSPACPPHSSIPMQPPQCIAETLAKLRRQYFPTPFRDYVVIFILWMFLLLSICAALVGYVGCFTLLSKGTQTSSLIWLGLEFALCYVRFLLWALNPTCDEGTEVSVKVKLMDPDHLPLVTTDKDIDVIRSTGNVIDLVPEQTFLERITLYTGSVQQFNNPREVLLYFTLSGDRRNGRKYLFMTALLANKHAVVTLYQENGVLKYVYASMVPNRLQAVLQSPIPEDHTILSDRLSDYYLYLLHTLNRLSDRPPPALTTAALPYTWRLTPKLATFEKQNDLRAITSVPLTENEHLYLRRGYEHHLKAKLIENWGKWIIDGLEAMYVSGHEYCCYVSGDPSSEEARWELTELDTQLVWEWTRRELILLEMSVKLESILRRRMEACVEKMVTERTKGRLEEWLLAQFSNGMEQRLGSEMEAAKKRMEEARKVAAERAKGEGRPWKDEARYFDNVGTIWQRAEAFIDDTWMVAIKSGASALEKAPFYLQMLVENHQLDGWNVELRHRRTFVERLRPRFMHWISERNKERLEMEATIQMISDADFEHLDEAYEYPGSSDLVTAVHSKFVDLSGYTSKKMQAFVARVSSATVYDVNGCDLDVVRDVIHNINANSILNVDQSLIQGIPANDHLLYLSSGGKEVLLPFIERNRKRWRASQTNTSWAVYFSPQSIDSDGQYVCNSSGTIAHIWLFLQPSSYLRLRLLHCHADRVSVSVRQQDKELLLIRTDTLPQNGLGLQDFDLNQFKAGSYALELVVQTGKEAINFYKLRDISVEFLDAPWIDGDNREEKQGHMDERVDGPRDTQDLVLRENAVAVLTGSHTGSIR